MFFAPQRTLAQYSLLAAAAFLPTALGASAQVCPSTESCLVAHTNPGCDSAACCTTVCAIDPSCCGGTGWDAGCVVFANSNCVGYPGAAASGSCFTPHKNPNCDSAACSTTVCALDPSCCSFSWDSTCVLLASLLCAGNPRTCGEPGTGSCFITSTSGACSDVACCEAVCALDETCCLAAWDAICVSIAGQLCVVGCVPTAEPDAILEGELCGERGNDPCYAVGSGTPQPLEAGVQVTGRLGASNPPQTPVDVDVYRVTVVDTDGDGLARVALAFTSSPKAWAALIPEAACAPVAGALVVASSELCLEAALFPACVPPGEYRVVVAGGTYPQIGGASIDCFGSSTYNLKVVVTQACGDACATAADSCFVPHAPRGCNDPVCCAAVCALDVLCCEDGWDPACVAAAGDACLSGPPVNDTCAGALPLAEGETIANTLRSSLELPAGAKACGSATFGRDVWYQWTSDRNGQVTVSSCGPWFDTILAVYTGDCAAPVLVGCNDNASSCGGIGSRVTFTAQCDTTYYVRVGPRIGTGGEVALTLASSAPTCVGCVGDFNRDGMIGGADLAFLLGSWETPAADIDGNGITGGSDLAILLGSWGVCP